MAPEDLDDRLRRHEAMIEALAKVWTRQGEINEEQREINDRLTAAIERVETSMAVPGGLTIAQFNDPDGNVVGILKPAAM
jgi:hypothetical protein